VLVLSLLWDQWDNGQRIHETGLGLQLLPFKLTEAELLGAVDQLLADELLERRMATISKRIQSTNSQSKVADLVEKVAANNRIKK
jgi:UDP:flavonoid glycosyltransferase YjiC (YdhE family)